MWLAYAEATNAPVALKVLDQGSAQSSVLELEAVKTYKKLALAGGESGLMSIDHVGLVEGKVFYVMPLADGEDPAVSPEDAAWKARTLSGDIARQRHAPAWFTPGEIAAWLAPICSAAQTLANAGLVHRDIKPDNLLFFRGQPVLSDVSLLRADTHTVTRIGTPGYSAPTWYVETGGKLDMFSLAATLFTFLTGNPPDKLGRATFRWPPQGEASLDPLAHTAWLHFHRIILRATHEEATERYLTFAALGDALLEGAGNAHAASHAANTTPPTQPITPSVTLRVRLLAPPDVEDELAASHEVIARVGRLYYPRLALELLSAENLPQENPAPATDLVIGILWSQLNITSEATTATTPAMSASGNELREHLLRFKSASTGQAPDLMLFVKTAPPPTPHATANGSDASSREYEAVHALLAELAPSTAHAPHSPASALALVPTRFPDTDSFARLLELHLRQWLERFAPLPEVNASGAPLWPEGNPYRGLAPFDPEHAKVFFGRDAARAQALQRLSQPGGGFLLVVGGSGTGKSSFVRAGLIPHLPPVLPGGQASAWTWTITSPAGDGLGPLAGLLHALRKSLPKWKHGLEHDSALLARLRPNPGALGLLLAQALATQDSPEGEMRCLFLLVDQGEELFAAGVTEEERTAYVAALESLLATSRIWISLTLRADRYGELQRVPALLALKDGRQLDLAPPSATEMAEIIVRPALAAGLAFEFLHGRFLNQVIAEEARHFGECLPLLQFTLSRLYEAAQPTTGHRLLTYAAYADIGGLSGALARHATLSETSLREKLGDATTPTLARLFAALVRTEADDNALPLRRHALLADLNKNTETRTALDHLVTSRLLATGGDSARPVVTLAHEILLTQWPSLALWLDQHRRTLRDRARLEPQAQLWLAQAKRADLLLPEGQALALAEDVLNAIEVAPELRDYIESSRAHATKLREATEQHQRRRARQWAIAAFAGLGLAVAATVFGFSASKAKDAEQVEQQRTQEALTKTQALATQLQKNEELLTENLTPLIFSIIVGNGDPKLKLTANEFLDSTQGLFKPKYYPNSFKKSFQAAQLGLQLANAVTQARPELSTNSMLGKTPSAADKLLLQKALSYAELSEAIFSEMGKSPTLLADLKANGSTASLNDFFVVSSESLMARASVEFLLGNYFDAIPLLTDFTTKMSEWKPDMANGAEAKAFNLFETYTNLAHCYRLTGDMPKAIRTMGLALDAGEVAIGKNTARLQAVILRYAFADYLNMLDEKHLSKYTAVLANENVTPAQMRTVLASMLPADAPPPAPKRPGSLLLRP